MLPGYYHYIKFQYGTKYSFHRNSKTAAHMKGQFNYVNHAFKSNNAFRSKVEKPGSIIISKY